MPEDSTSGSSRRRTFLKSLAAVGVGATLGSGRAGAQDSLDAYHQTLREDLTSGEGLPQGEFVYGTTEQATLDAFTLQGGDQGTETEFDVSADVPITLGDRVEINEDPSDAFSYTYKSNITDRTVEAGDVLLAVAYLRGAGTPDPGTSPEVQCEFKYQFTDPDGETGFSADFVQGTDNVSPGPEWRRYYFPIEVETRPDGSDHIPYLEFWTGFRQQTVEFGGVALIDYSDTDATVDDLPVTEFDYEYPGRAEDAAWRSDAHDRIQDLRTADYEVEVVDRHGDPVEGAVVDVAMQEHDFGFGTAVAVNQLPDGNETYRRKLLEDFNKAVPENGLKVPAWEGEYGESLGPESTRAALQWLQDNDVPTRGHALVWSTYDWMGIDSSLSASEINSQVQSKIAERANEFEGQLPEWDMHNHPLFYSEIWDDIGRDAVLDWWQAAHDADSGSRMYINEMNVLAGDSLRQDYLDHVQWLQDNDAGVEGIGFMGHFGLGGLTPPEELLSTLDDFAEFGVPLQITEFDVEINDRGRDNEVAAQRDYVRDLLTAAFSHEAVEGVMSWGFWPDEHWIPTAAYYDSDWTLRPHGEEYHRLVFDEWWTEASGTADADGQFTGSGFKGEYEISARDGARYGEASVTLGDDGASVTVELEPVSIGDLDLAVDRQVLRDDATDAIEATLYDRDGDELPIPDGAIAYESDAPDVLAVDEDGVVSAAGTGTGTVTVTVTAYGDTAIGSVQFAADAGPAVVDTAADLSVADSSSGVFAGSYAERHGDGTFFQKNEAGGSGSLTYNVEDGIHSARTVAYVNNAEIDGEGDVFDELVFETSADGESFTQIDAEHTTREAPSDANGFWALWSYELQAAIPDDATYLRVTIPETQNGFAVVIGRVEIRDAPPVENPTAPVVSDPAEDFTLTSSRSGVSVGEYETRLDDQAWFEKNAADATGSVTYQVSDGITSFHTVAYVNNGEMDDDSDPFEDLRFEVSSDGDSFEAVAADATTTIAATESTGYWAQWEYEVNSGIPSDATYLRITIPETVNNWGVNVGSVDIWSVDATDTDQTGPAIVVDDLQPGATYTGVRPFSVSATDDQTEVTDHSFALDGTALSERSPFGFGDDGDDGDADFGGWGDAHDGNESEGDGWAGNSSGWGGQDPPEWNGSAWDGADSGWGGNHSGWGGDLNGTEGDFGGLNGTEGDFGNWNGSDGEFGGWGDTDGGHWMDGPDDVAVWQGGFVIARGDHTLSVGATNAADVTTAADLGFAIQHPTGLRVDDGHGWGEPEVTATLTDAVTFQPLPDREIAFAVDGETVHTATTDDHGVVSVPQSDLFEDEPPRGGSLEVTGSFAGEEFLLASEDAETVRPGHGRGRGHWGGFGSGRSGRGFGGDGDGDEHDGRGRRAWGHRGDDGFDFDG